MKKSLLAVLGTLLLACVAITLSLPADAQSVIRGEISAGSYGNIKTDSSGNLYVTTTSSGTTAVTQSGTWTVQPGNTANTTAWKVDGSAVNQPVVGNVASAATDSGNPVKVGAKYNSTIPTFTDGQRGDLQLDSSGNLRVRHTGSEVAATDAFSNTFIYLSSATAGNVRLQGVGGYVYNGSTWDRARGDTTGTYVVSVASAVGGYSFLNIAANATNTVKSGAGFFHSLVINTKGITNTVTCYDNTAASGTKIATIDTTITEATLLYDVAFATGLTCITAGGTSADITVTYK